MMRRSVSMVIILSLMLLPMSRLYCQPRFDRGDMLCGPKSLLAVCQLFDIDTSLDELIHLTGVSDRGTSMYSLFQAARKMNLSVSARKLTFDELEKLRTPVIAHVSGDHFLVVDGVFDGFVRIINHDINAPYIVSKREFSGEFDGACLVFSRPPRKRNAPKIVFDSVFYNFGSAPRGSTVNHEFTFRNEGDAPLHIKSITATCGCLVIGPGRRTIPPGEKGAISASMTLDPELREQRQSRTIVVRTNDPAQPIILLTLAGELKGMVGVSPRRVYIGKVKANSIIRKSITLHRAKEYPFELVSVKTSSDRIRIHKESETDNRILITLTVGPGLPAGPLSEKVVFFIKELYTKPAQIAQVVVPVEGEIIGEVMVHPKQFFFGFAPSTGGVSSTVELTNHTDKPLKITRVYSESPYLDLQVTPVEQGRRYVIRASLKGDNIPPGKFEAVVLIHIAGKHEKVIKVPAYGVVIERHPSKPKTE